MSFNPLNYPFCLSKPQRLTDVTSWHEHIPFAFAIMQMQKPKTFVELGTHKGDSYCAFCQAVEALGLDTACYAVDTWEGDEQSGFYGPEILKTLHEYHDPLYGSFSRLIQSQFDKALDHFSDGSIDLLHIDGLHIYDAVLHDFESWLPKMSSQGVVLFHDINVRERNFGVWRLWQDLKINYPWVEFRHGNGLGVLAVGSEIPKKVLEFFLIGEQDPVGISKFFSHLGNTIALQDQSEREHSHLLDLSSVQKIKDSQITHLEQHSKNLEDTIAERESQIADLEQHSKNLETIISESESRVTNLEQHSKNLETIISESESRVTNLEQHSKDLENIIRDKESQIANISHQLQSMQESMVWQLLMKFDHGFVERVLPLGTRRRRQYDLAIRKGKLLVKKELQKKIVSLDKNREIDRSPSSGLNNNINFLNFYRKREMEPTVQQHIKTVDVIICVHNALQDVEKCLSSIIQFTTLPYSIILVDDGCDKPTKTFLEDFAQTHGVQLLQNEMAKGYTFAANQGLRSSTADFVVLLNSDTIVTPEWIDRMIACAESDDDAGIVGPLSNTASWQSVPDIDAEDGDWAQNVLPDTMSTEQMGRAIARYSGRLYPRISFLNGFCLLIKRDLINDIGYFDEEHFGKGYGEENDYCLRARKSQWNLLVADDVYIFHAQSRSYSTEKRKELCTAANDALVNKHGQAVITEGVFNCRHDRVLEGIRARTRTFFIRQKLIQDAKNQWKDKRILIVLPVIDPGGGAYVVIQESKAMLDMGVQVCLLNLRTSKEQFENNYPDLKLPVIYAHPDELGIIATKFDAVIATLNVSVGWLESIIQKDGLPIRGYYIQDFEPNFYPEGSKEFKTAWESYTKYPDLLRITKTQWNAEVVKKNTGVNCHIVGPSVDIDLFRPRQRIRGITQNRPIYIGAMIRPSTPRRCALQTMNILGEVWRHNKNTVKIITFGCKKIELDTLNFSNDFDFDHIDTVITREELALLLNELDIFVDFSSYQAMGLTALEAMACGATVIVPQTGGSNAFVKHKQNGLVVDTTSETACFNALNLLIRDTEFRIKLGKQALKDACEFPPEKAAYTTLIALFKKGENTDLLLHQEDMIPPDEMIFVGPGDFKQTGNEFFKYFIELGNLKSNEKVLDVGCGIGRMAIPLTRYLDKNGSYDGFDIVPMGVDWCQKNISTKYSNFHFQIADNFNRFYNPNCMFKSSEYKFPYSDESFDFIFLTSVFTHMLPTDMENYFTEIARVLKINGRCLITFFLLNAESYQLIKAKKSTQDFQFAFDGYHTVDKKIPESAVAYEEHIIRDLYKKFGLTIDDPIRFGSWCGRKNYTSYQDIILAVKTGSKNSTSSTHSDK